METKMETRTDNKEQLNLYGNSTNDERTFRRFRSNTIFPKTVFLKNIRTWRNLFQGFPKIRGVTFVTSPDFLLSLYSDYDFEEVELLVGASLMDGYKKDLVGKEAAIESLYSRVCDGSLKLHGSKINIHTKMYILTNKEKTRVITGSPNLSYTAAGSKQREYAWYVDIPHGDINGHNFLEQIEVDFQRHMEEAEPQLFMQDLQNLRKNSQNEAIEDYKLWSTSENLDGSNAMRTIIKEVQNVAFAEDEETEEIFTITIPKSVKKSDQKYLSSNYGAKIQNGKAIFNRSLVLHEKTNHGMPNMRINPADGEVTIALGGGKYSLPIEVSPEEINSGLKDIESYIGLVDGGVCHHPAAVKMTMMEVILYTMAAPFANQWLIKKREKVSLTDRRGPRHLLIYGPGNNGKTTLGRFQNHLLSGKPIHPVNGKTHVKKDWDGLFEHITTNGSPYPVIVDDIKQNCFTGARGNLEAWIKAYWENSWSSEKTYPLGIFNTNHDRMEEWSKTRVRRLDFLVKFKGTSDEQIRLQGLLERQNLVFPAFSKIYSNHLSQGAEYSMDELKIARSVFLELYRIAERKVPDFFPHKQPEEIYDMDAIYCAHREKYQLFKESRIGGGIRLEFNSWQSLKNFQSRLPPTVSSIQDDLVLIIENPEDYRKFMDKGREESSFKRLFRKIRGR